VPFTGVVSAPSGFFVAGGATSGTAVNLQSVINTQTGETVFDLGDGWFQGTNITRSGIIVQAVNSRLAQFAGGIDINAADVTIDGLKIDCNNTFTGVEIFDPGATVRDCHIFDFGKTTFTQGVWIYQEALLAANPIIVEDCLVEDWGGQQFVCAVSVGLAADADKTTPAKESVVIRNNQVLTGPTASNMFSAGIQLFHPGIVHGNRVDRVSGTTCQVKASHSWIYCNELSGSVDGAMYNREDSNNNLWEHNWVHDSNVGVDHFMGDDCTYRHNVISDCPQAMRIKDQATAPLTGTDNLQFLSNTIYNMTGGGAAIFWDTTSGQGTITNVVISNNVFSVVNSAVIDEAGDPPGAASGSGNVFHSVGGTPTVISGATANPNLADPAADDFEVTNPTYAGVAGATWPRPC
jgi:hypothetical protein